MKILEISIKICYRGQPRTIVSFWLTFLSLYTTGGKNFQTNTIPYRIYIIMERGVQEVCLRLFVYIVRPHYKFSFICLFVWLHCASPLCVFVCLFVRWVTMCVPNLCFRLFGYIMHPNSVFSFGLLVTLCIPTLCFRWMEEKL